jgi:AraC-like DNA-binding protein
MVLRPICEPVELPAGASVLAERVSVSADAPAIGGFRHFHDVAELVLFCRVRGEFIADRSRHALRDGSVVFVPSMRQHDYALERGAMEWLLIQIDPFVVESLGLAERLAALSRPFSADPDPQIRDRLEMLGDGLLDAIGRNARGEIERIVELLLLAVAELAPADPVGEADHHLHAERLLPALERLRTMPAEPLDLESAATLCRLSPTYFSRRFRQLFGMTFSDYSRIHRLHLAARRLVGSGAGISEIAFGVGFSSPAHFSARFRERFGMTPREYRATARSRATVQGRANEPD